MYGTLARISGVICGGLAAVGIGWAAVSAERAGLPSTDSLPPIAPEIAARLPKFCRYDVDLSAVANPHQAVLAHTELGDRTCPFSDTEATLVHIYRPSPPGGCGPADLKDLKVVATRQLGGRAFRQETRCVTDITDSRAQPAAHGRTYLLKFDMSKASPGELSRFASDADDERMGAPFTASASGVSGPDFPRGTFFKCVQMLPRQADGALTFYRRTGRPLPVGTVEEEVTAEDCGKLIRDQVGESGVSGGLAMDRTDLEEGQFQLSLSPSDITPEGDDFFRLAREVFAQDGLKPARRGGRETIRFGRVIVSRTPDGGYLAVAGGPDDFLLSIDVRTLTPGICVVIFHLAAVTGLYIGTVEGDNMHLRPASLAASPVSKTASAAIPVTDAADLCALLRPGFDEWRIDQPGLPVDLHDLDRNRVKYITGTIVESSPAEDPAQNAAPGPSVPSQ